MTWCITEMIHRPLGQLLEQYEKTGGTIVGCQLVERERVSSYGIIKGNLTEKYDLVLVEDMVEKPKK